MLKNKLWKRRITIEVEIAMFRGAQMVEETILLEEIRKNNTRNVRHSSHLKMKVCRVGLDMHRV